MLLNYQTLIYVTIFMVILTGSSLLILNIISYLIPLLLFLGGHGYQFSYPIPVRVCAGILCRKTNTNIIMPFSSTYVLLCSPNRTQAIIKPTLTRKARLPELVVNYVSHIKTWPWNVQDWYYYCKGRCFFVIIWSKSMNRFQPDIKKEQF